MDRISDQSSSDVPVAVDVVEHPRDTVRFVKTWWRVYRDDPLWVPPLIAERKRFFHPRKNPYFETADVRSFVASREGEDVGTITATIDYGYQTREPGVAFFGFFDFIDDLEVASALLRAARDWMREHGMRSAIGPFNLNTNHEFGLLIDGFDTPPFVANPHNSAYFPEIYEALGLEKIMDWYAYRIDPAAERVLRMRAIAERFLKRHPEVVIRNLDMKRFGRDVALLHRIYDDAWEHNWGHVRVSEREFQYLANSLKAIIDPSLCFVAEVAGEPAAISVTLPDYNRLVKRLDGRLFPTGWWTLLRGRNKIDAVRVFMLGVKQEYQHLPLGAPLYWKTWERGLALGVREAEASLVLETNTRMRGALERMGATIYKTYRNYRIEL
ncbi:MAG: N-acetyltransferase [bacterium]|nr:N-acetyltransferase [bacterium]